MKCRGKGDSTREVVGDGVGSSDGGVQVAVAAPSHVDCSGCSPDFRSGRPTNDGPMAQWPNGTMMVDASDAIGT